jgi:RimJ/RimL family protein N-acetyltransferase
MASVNVDLGPCTLDGRSVRLEPLRKVHREALIEAAQNLDWGWFLAPLRTPVDVDSRLSEASRAEERGEAYAFAVRLLRGNRIVGSTSYRAVVPRHKRVEIGSTWYTRDVQGTAVNPECKYLLLRHAFEDWGARRVEFITDSNNIHSQRAIEKLGAKREGVMRNHDIRMDGSMRDTVLYSIIAPEWPDVKQRLESRLALF